MGPPAATKDDQVVGIDVHVVMVPAGPSLVPTPLPHPFAGKIDRATESTVLIAGKAAAVQGSKATNQPSHVPTPPGVSFQSPPANEAEIVVGSTTVLAGGKPVARTGDTAKTCNDPAPLPVGTVVATRTVFVG